LTAARARKAIFKAPHISFLSEIGWVFIIWAMFFFARMFVLGADLPGFVNMFFFVGFPLIMLFTNPNKNIFKAISSVVINLPLDAISAFTDVVSYIRLYAVGLATVAVADSANQMSIFWILLLHTVNIILAAMAILVHGIRLNILEFSGHLGMEWTGIEYDPLRKKNQNTIVE
jgi:V/A-type H+-transporting ATPase subunit I